MRNRMRAVGVLFFAALAFGSATAWAQGPDPALIHQAIAACGPGDVHLSVSAAPENAVASAPPGKAEVYLIGSSLKGGLSGPVFRVGMDGNWVGAFKGSSYMAIAATPGAHHFCVWSQSRGEPPNVETDVALNVLQLRAGETYYLTMDSPDFVPLGIPALDEVNADEARLLIGSRSLS